jgi:UDP-glucose 4-epimerase
VSAPALTWVIGSHGLLGQHVRRHVERPWVAHEVPWLTGLDANTALRQGIRALLDAAADGPWSIAWCAGAGVVATPADLVEQERRVFGAFLEDLAELAGPSSDGALFFASSAGGVYADSTGPPFTEATVPRPRTPYGRAKLEMEGDLTSFAERTGIPVLVARIANLFGPGQNLAKAQGLISQICLTHLTGHPLALYVPLDTMRDYLYVEDCARMIVSGLAGLRERAAGPGAAPVVTKIFGSGHSTTVGGLLGESTRLFRQRPRVVLGASPAAAGQVRDLRLRSNRWPELDRLARTPLPVGIAATAEDVGRRLRAAAS